MALTSKQKRALVKAGEPLLRLLYFLYRLLSGGCSTAKSLESVPSVAKILVLRMDSIGDVLLSEPAIAHLRCRFPKARIDVVVGRGGKEVLEGNPNINSIRVYSAPWHEAWRGKRVNWALELAHLWRLVRQLRLSHYDLVFELRGDLRDILMAVASGARIKVGNSQRGGGSLLDYDIPINSRVHAVEFALAIAAAGASQEGRLWPRLYIKSGHRNRGQLQGMPQGQYIALHLGAGFPNKRLPLAKFAQVATHLWQKGSFNIALVGGAEDTELAKDFQKLVSFAPINLVGRLRPLETAAILEHCALFIGNDSLPMHLAAAVSTPIVTFFGPSEAQRYHPYGVPYRLLEVELACRPCDLVHCPYKEPLCLTSIAVEDIVAAAEDLLAATETRRI